MEFSINKVFTVLDGDSLPKGTRFIGANTLHQLRERVTNAKYPSMCMYLTRLKNFSDTDICCFNTGDPSGGYSLAYALPDNKLVWSDLQLGDVIYSGSLRAEVTAIDEQHEPHIFAAGKWIDDATLEQDWFKEV